MSEKHKNVCRVWNHIEHLLIVISKITGCVPISSFAYLVGMPRGITCSPIGLKICIIIAGIEKHQSTIKKKKKHDKIALLAKL